MEVAELLKQKREEILRLAAKHGVKNIRVFGFGVEGQLFLDTTTKASPRLNRLIPVVEELDLLVGSESNFQTSCKELVYGFAHPRIISFHNHNYWPAMPPCTNWRSMF